MTMRKRKKNRVSIEKEQIVLLELIKASLFWEIPEIPDDTDWEKVYELARTQCIVPLLEPVVPSVFRAKWSEDTLQSMSRYMQVAYEQGELISIFREHGIPLVIVKGSAAAMYYPEPARRLMGDIDFLVPPELYDEARKLMEQNDYVFCEEDYRHAEYVKNEIEFEVHKQFSCNDYNDIEHILAKGIDHIQNYEINLFAFPGLPHYENGLVILGHMMQHINNSGLGLRQIIDWMLFVHGELDDEAWEKHFRTMAEEAGLDKLAVTITCLCIKWLGLPDNISWANQADEELGDLTLARILADGNFGINRFSSSIVGANIKKEGLFAYLQRSGMKNWSLAQKYPFFRPFAWLFQVFRYMGRGIKSCFTGRNELKGIRESEDLEEIRRGLKS